MIKPSELRIGNLFFVKPIKENDFKGHEDFVNGLSDEGVNFYFDDTHSGVKYSKNDIKPILLTKEWLLRFGLMISENGSCWVNNTFELRKNIDESYTLYAWNKGNNVFIKHINHIHKLQNLYFALTGEELTIK